MTNALKSLLPGIIMIIISSLVLLLADNGHREKSLKKLPNIAILQFSSRPVLDDSVAGAIEGLKAQGLEPDRDIRIKFYNAENDLPTASSMAKAMTEEDNSLVITFSSPALQVMANVNRDKKIRHLFGAVTDPFAAGVGISKTGHPPYLTGIGTFQPVREVFQLAKKMNPDLRKAGVVWNPADAASEACILLARDECARLGITLLEVQVDSSSGVAEAAGALTSRGVQALWIGGDNTVELAIDSLAIAGHKAGIPVFCNAPSHVTKGAFIGLGADYREVGHLTGELAARILKGLSPADVPVKNVVPIQLGINLSSLKGMREKWSVDAASLSQAAILIDAQGKTVRSPAEPKVASTPPKKWNIQLLDYADSINTEETHTGLFAEFKALGLAEGRDFLLKRRSAHGDISVLNGIIDAAINENPDLIITTSTQTLQAAVNKIKKIPVVFTTVADGVQAGAGTSDTSHLPNFTGVTCMSDFDGMIAVILECFPKAKRIGTLFVPSEINSVRYRDELVKSAGKRGLTVVSVGVSSPSDASDATLALAGKGVTVIAQISDNTTGSAFTAIAEAARKSGIPLFGFVSSTVKDGAALAVARNYEEAGQLAARLVNRIIKGESPASIPFTPLSRTSITVSRGNAASFKMQLPQSIIKKADKVVN